MADVIEIIGPFWNRYALTKSFLIAFTIFLCCSIVRAAAPAKTCAPSWDSRCVWAEAGELSLAEIAARGDEIMRFAGSASPRPRDGFLAALRHSRSGAFELVIRDPAVPGNVITRPVTRTLWVSLAALRARFAAENALAEARSTANDARLKAKGIETVCLDDGAVIQIDTVLRGRADRIYAYSCHNAAVEGVARRIATLLYGQIPYCMRLAPELRSICPSLHGDKALAAAAAPAVLEFADDVCFAPASARMSARIASSATVRFDGADAVTGPPGAILAALCRDNFSFVLRDIDARASIVIVTGVAWGEWHEPLTGDAYRARATIARGTQLWRIDAGRPKLESWTIGKFALSE